MLPQGRMVMNERGVTTVLLVLSIGAMLSLFVLSLVNGQIEFAITDLVAAALMGALLWAHIKGFRWAAHVFVVGVTLALIAVAPTNPVERDAFAFNILTPPILAAVLINWRWSVATYVTSLGGVALLWAGQGLLFRPTVLIILTLQATGIVLASVIARAAQHHAEAQAARVEASLAETEQQRSVLAQQAHDLQAQNVEQQRLLELVNVLEVPIITLADDVLLAPIVGAMDSRRAVELNGRLLQAVNNHHAKLLILDIAGVNMVDTYVARALVEAAQAVRLLGCDVSLCGISAAVAMTMTNLQIDLQRIITTRSPQEAIELYRKNKAAEGASQAGIKLYGLN